MGETRGEKRTIIVEMTPEFMGVLRKLTRKKTAARLTLLVSRAAAFHHLC